MTSGRRNREGMTHEELYSELLATSDWNIGMTSSSTYGVTITFRKHYTSDMPGMETREVFGKDDADAIRKFLEDLDEQAAS
jgi:hypothetical protein